MQQRGILPFFRPAAAVLFCGLFFSSLSAKDDKTETRTPLAEAEAFRKDGKERKAIAVWKKLSREDSPEGACAVYHLNKQDFLVPKLAPARRKSLVVSLEKRIASENRALPRLILCVLFAESQTESPDWLKRAFDDGLLSSELRFVAVASFGEGLRAKNIRQFSSALAMFQKALESYDRLARGDSNSDGDNGAVDPILPWSRARIADEIRALQEILKNRDDSKIHAEAIRLYGERKFSAANPLFETILRDFPESKFTESAFFHRAACAALLYRPPAKKNFDQAKFEQPLLDYVAKYPLDVEPPAVPGVFHGPAWTLIGDARYVDKTSSLESVSAAWEEAAAAFLIQGDSGNRDLSKLYLRLGILAHRNKNFEDAIHYYKGCYGAYEKNEHHPDIWGNAVKLLLKSANDRKPLLELFCVKIDVEKDTPFNRIIAFAAAAQVAWQLPIANHFLEFIPARNLVVTSEQELFYRFVRFLVLVTMQTDTEEMDSFLAFLDKQKKHKNLPAIMIMAANELGCSTEYSEERRIEVLKRVTKQFPGTEEAYLAYRQLGFIHIINAIDAEEKDFQEALEFYKTALRKFPEFSKRDNLKEILEGTCRLYAEERKKYLEEKNQNLQNEKDAP